jgi:hypothetical protein
MTSTWETRDLPVLKAVVALTDEGGDYIEPPEIGGANGLR